jgi:hypothetical protein
MLAHSALEELAETWMVLDQAVDQIVFFRQWNQLKGWFAVDRHYDRLIVAELTVAAQFGLSLA